MGPSLWLLLFISGPLSSVYFREFEYLGGVGNGAETRAEMMAEASFERTDEEWKKTFFYSKIP